MSGLAEYLKMGADEIGVRVEAQHQEKFSLLAAELSRWNRKVNLTSISRSEDIAIKHFLDSLVVLKFINLNGKLLDLGSGGGFPCIPLKILVPDLAVWSVDAVEKKIHFQRHISRLLGFNNFQAIHARGENLKADYSERFNFIISRAFSDIPKFVTMAQPLLAPKGQLIAMKGPDGIREADGAIGIMGELGLAIVAVHEFNLPLVNDSRSLIVIAKK